MSEQLKSSKQEIENLNQSLLNSKNKTEKGDNLYNDLVILNFKNTKKTKKKMLFVLKQKNIGC